MNAPHWYKKLDAVKTVMFDMGSCECCGSLIQEANAVGGLAKEIHKYKTLGMREWTGPILPETYYDENTDATACYFCNGKLTPPENTIRRIKEVLVCVDLTPMERIAKAIYMADKILADCAGTTK